MNYVNAVIEDKASFERALDIELPVFVVFISDSCPACTDAMPRFARMAKKVQGRVKVLVLDCQDTPRHPSVTRIPMLLVYRHSVLLETLPGLAEQRLVDVFSRYTGLPVATFHSVPAPAQPPN